jgi:hypothetical protein
VPNPLYLNDNGSLDSLIVDLFAAYASATISSGVVAFSASAMQIDTQGAAAEDDLDTITTANAEAGTSLFVRSTAAGRVVVLKDRTGNIFSAEGDVRLSDPQNMVLLVYSGTYWVVIGGGGRAARPAVVTTGLGVDRRCVIADRATTWISSVVSDVANARAGGLYSVTLALSNAIRMVNADADESAIAALAAAFVSSYANASAITSAFSTTVYNNVRRSLYCANTDGDTAYSANETLNAIVLVDGYTGVPHDLIADLLRIIGAAGLTRAVGLSTAVTTSATCGSTLVYTALDTTTFDESPAKWSFITVNSLCGNITPAAGNMIVDTGFGNPSSSARSDKTANTRCSALGINIFPDTYPGILGDVARVSFDVYWNSSTAPVKWLRLDAQCYSATVSTVLVTKVYESAATATVMSPWGFNKTGVLPKETWFTVDLDFAMANVRYATVRFQTEGPGSGNSAPLPIWIDNVVIKAASFLDGC